MTLNELKYIVAVAREQHFGRAATACHVSQPTLSVAVKKLEEELGVSLFERRKGQITVTPVGVRVVDKAQDIIEQAQSIKQLAQHSQDQLAGSIRLGAIYTIGPYLLPHLIPRLNEAAPHMPLIVEENYTAVLLDKLKRGDLDVILVSLPFNDPAILTMPLYQEPFVLLIPSSHPFNQYERIRVDQLKNENVLLLGSGHCFRDQVLAVCPDCGMHDAKDQFDGSSLETIRYMVASGLGITVLPCTAAGAERFSERLLSIRRFADQTSGRTVALAWRKSFPRPLAINTVREAVLNCQMSCVKGVE